MTPPSNISLLEQIIVAINVPKVTMYTRSVPCRDLGRSVHRVRMEHSWRSITQRRNVNHAHPVMLVFNPRLRWGLVQPAGIERVDALPECSAIISYRTPSTVKTAQCVKRLVYVYHAKEKLMPSVDVNRDFSTMRRNVTPVTAVRIALNVSRVPMCRWMSLEFSAWSPVHS